MLIKRFVVALAPGCYTFRFSSVVRSTFASSYWVNLRYILNPGSPKSLILECSLLQDVFNKIFYFLKLEMLLASLIVVEGLYKIALSSSISILNV